VRELALLARRLLALHPNDAVLSQTMLSESLRPAENAPAEAASPENPAPAADDSPDPDPAAVLAALRAERGNVKRTAASLGISRGRLYRLMEKMESLDLHVIRQVEDE
jgi:DNA-binding NtrC family response regulator